MAAQTTSIRLPDELRQELEKASHNLHRGKNWIIIQALQAYLRRSSKQSSANPLDELNRKELETSENQMSRANVKIDDELDQPLEAATREVRRSKTWIVNEALREYFERQAVEQQRWQDTLEALEDIRMGHVIDGDKVDAWLESWGTDNELEPPKT